jgi:transcriptional regulator with XRE-family HTH domain
MLPKNWTGDLVGLMHVHKISKKQLADHIGVTREYVSLVLNGHREPAGAEEKFKTAVDEIISNASTS